jgi:uridine kinase
VSDLSALTRPAMLGELAALVGGLAEPVRVGIDGPDAAGKTTLADELAPLVAPRGRRVSRISADDFLRPPAERHRRGRFSPEGYYEDSFDLDALRAAVLAAGGVVLVDGIFLLRPELDDLWSLRVVVAVAEEESPRRGVERDGAEKEQLYRTRYLPGQRMYAEQARPRDRADVVVENDDPDRPRLLVRRGEPAPGA